MNKQILSFAMLVAAVSATASGAAAAAPVTLAIESWRSEDLAIWRDQIIPAFEKTHANIQVKFTPTAPTEYNAALNSRLDAGTAGDLVTCRPFDASLDLFKKGRLVSLNDLKGMANFSPVARTAWSPPTLCGERPGPASWQTTRRRAAGYPDDGNGSNPADRIKYGPGAGKPRPRAILAAPRPSSARRQARPACATQCRACAASRNSSHERTGTRGCRSRHMRASVVPGPTSSTQSGRRSAKIGRAHV